MDEMRKRLRYHIDFEAIPMICQNGNGDAVCNLLHGGEALLASVYNRIWQQYYPERPFTPEDFVCRYVEDGNNRMIYTLPCLPTI